MDNEKFVALKKRQAALMHEQRAIEAQLQELNEAPAAPAVEPEPVAPEETPEGNNEGGPENSSTSPDDSSASVPDDDTPPVETPDEEGKGTNDGESSATPN